MKRATAAVRALLIRAALATGLEGGFLIAGTALLAVGSSYLSPAGPWIVVGAVALLVGFALIVPTPKKPS